MGKSDSPNGLHKAGYLVGTDVAETILASTQLGAQKGRTYGSKRSDLIIATSPCKEGVVHIWGQAEPSRLGEIRQPVLVANGDDDVMAPTINSVELARGLPDARLSIFPDAGHGGIFQYHEAFVQQALAFLR